MFIRRVQVYLHTGSLFSRDFLLLEENDPILMCSSDLMFNRGNFELSLLPLLGSQFTKLSIVYHVISRGINQSAWRTDLRTVIGYARVDLCNMSTAIICQIHRVSDPMMNKTDMFVVRSYHRNISYFVSDCKDEDRDCAYWASIGECDKNPDYMRTSCKRACASCWRCYCWKNKIVLRWAICSFVNQQIESQTIWPSSGQ